MRRKVRNCMIIFVVLGYIAGAFIGWSELRYETIEKPFCVSWEGPTHCDPREDCDRWCLEYQLRPVSRVGEAFYIRGPIGAFVGGWVAVFFVTYVLKK